MLFEAICAPSEEFEHVRIFLSMFVGFAEDMLWEDDSVGRLRGRLFQGFALHLEI